MFAGVFVTASDDEKKWFCLEKKLLMHLRSGGEGSILV